jgi:hypothetical protein
MLTSVLIKPSTCGRNRYTARNSRNLDVAHNKAMMNIGTNPDTGEFANDSIGHLRTTQGQFAYTNASSVLMLMNGVNIRSSRHYKTSKH